MAREKGRSGPKHSAGGQGQSAHRGAPDPFAYMHDPNDRPQAALEIANSRFRARPEVCGIDIGFKIQGGKHTAVVAVRIHVKEKVSVRHLTPRERFPKVILGVPVDVIAAVYEDHHAFDPARQTRVPVISPGVSVSSMDGDTGTLGLMLEDVVDGRSVVLGAAHVFAPSLASRPGETAIIQPGRADGGGTQDAACVLHRFDESTDTAVAAVLGGRPFTPHILGAARDVSGCRHPRLGDVLEKSGRTTGITRGRVDGIAQEFAGLHYVIRLVALDGATGPLCDFGDSGSVWYDPTTGEAVAVHCKGGSAPTMDNAYAIATSLIYATRNLGVRLPGSGGARAIE